MAKKKSKPAKKAAASRKSARKPVRAAKPARPAKAAKRPAARKSAAPKPAGLDTLAPGVHQLNTGRGPGPAEVGRDLVALFNADRASEVEKKWWAPDITSIEGMGTAFVGRKALDAKNHDWFKENTVLGGSAEGPFVGATGFAVKFRIEVKNNATGARTAMDEVGVYTVRDGKIVREEFMYGG